MDKPIDWESDYRALAEVEKAHQKQVAELIEIDKVKTSAAIGAIKLAKDMFISNDLYLPHTFDVLDIAIATLEK